MYHRPRGNQTICLEIAEFSGFTAEQLEVDSKSQDQVQNITYYAIAESARRNDIDSKSFWIRFQKSRNVSNYLYITQSLRVSDESTLDALATVIEENSSVIAAEIKHRLTTLYPNGTENEKTSVQISSDKFCSSFIMTYPFRP